MKPMCFYCNQPATLLCDFKLGWPIGGYERGRDGIEFPVRALAAPYTCDVPLCREHAQYRGWLHVSAGRKSYFDSYDYCLEHIDVPDASTTLMPESEADRLRRAVRANAQRRLMRKRGVPYPMPEMPQQGELF
ncbi:hypothetical protein [Burkholderia sp. BDU5]|uniref:hypothetical protein n=1 Tax=Burkholderia sp. BDU5 TaxID=1385590 RepID=UPI0009EA9ACA|nr:hypothetical protein [Burkholderia sp. BDU5]